jgi:Skp family chaperone for outer membrane proteins
MKQTYLPYLLLFCALGLSATAAYYSVVGLAVIFSSVAIPVVIMGTFLEISKISIATYLHSSWSKIYTAMKVYLVVAVVVLSFITSLGIYGLLSGGFHQNISKLEVGERVIQSVEVKKQRYEQIKQEYLQEKHTLDRDISALRGALSSKTTLSHVDKKTGAVINTESAGNRKAYETQLKETSTQREQLSRKIESLNDSITALDMHVLDLENTENASGELGVIKYVHELTGWSMNGIANTFILLLIFVFDPLAIMLVIATNQAFESSKPKYNIYGEVKSREPSFDESDEPVAPMPIYNVEDVIYPIAEEKPARDVTSELRKQLFGNDDTSKTY